MAYQALKTPSLEDRRDCPLNFSRPIVKEVSDMFTEQERLENVANLTIMNNRIEASEKEIARAEKLLDDMKDMHNELVSLRDFYAEVLNAINSIEDEA